MHIAVISMVRNEDDIIETFVRHCATFCDSIHLIDHDSDDDTVSVVHALQREGIPLTLRHERTFAQIQDICMTQLMHDIVVEYSPTFILPLDADEFVFAEQGANVRQTIEGVSPHHHVLKRFNYLPHPADDPEETHPLKRLRRRQSIAVLPPKLLLSGASINPETDSLTQGNHGLQRDGRAAELSPADIPLFIAHFPVRSHEQFSRKCMDGWRRHLAREDERKWRQAGHWHAMSDLYAAAHGTSYEHLCEAAMHAYGTRGAITEPPPLIDDPFLHPPRLTFSRQRSIV